MQRLIFYINSFERRKEKTMRRSDREIKDRAELLDVISRCDVCRLALNDEEGYPYILPLNFGEKDVDGQLTLYFHGAMEGKKYELMEKNPRASFEMDCSHELFMNDEKMSCTMKYESVIGRGRLELVPEEEKEEELAILMRHYHQEDFPFGRAAMPKTKVFRLVVEQMTGKRR